MYDIVLSNGMKKQGLTLIDAKSLKLFREPKSEAEARAACKSQCAMLHISGYGVDEGMAKDIAKARGVLLFSFSDILRESGFRRAIAISKMRLALEACRGAGANFAACTLAANSNELRTKHELLAFLSVLGIGTHEKKHSECILERICGKSGAAALQKESM